MGGGAELDFIFDYFARLIELGFFERVPVAGADHAGSDVDGAAVWIYVNQASEEIGVFTGGGGMEGNLGIADGFDWRGERRGLVDEDVLAVGEWLLIGGHGE